MRTSPELSHYAPRFAENGLANILREFPHHLDLTLEHERNTCRPRSLHPAFYGSYDWHSSVHMHWLLARILRLFPDLPQAGGIRHAFDMHFTAENIAAEVKFFLLPAQRGFERTYGWAWLLKLQAELHMLARMDADAAAWRNALQPLADLIIERYLEWLPLSGFPIRSGTHANSAFGLLFALDYAECVGHGGLKNAAQAMAHTWFAHDNRYPAHYEPGGEDFLSAGLQEAALMEHVMTAQNFARWWQAFCPPQPGLQRWLTPVRVTDPADPKLVHLDGFNLSRAWCWNILREKFSEAMSQSAASAVEALLAASLPQTVSGHYAGTHWLASFALLAMTHSL